LTDKSLISPDVSSGFKLNAIDFVVMLWLGSLHGVRVNVTRKRGAIRWRWITVTSP
jgi:hypothetical protein